MVIKTFGFVKINRP